MDRCCSPAEPVLYQLFLLWQQHEVAPELIKTERLQLIHVQTGQQLLHNLMTGAQYTPEAWRQQQQQRWAPEGLAYHEQCIWSRGSALTVH